MEVNITRRESIATLSASLLSASLFIDSANSEEPSQALTPEESFKKASEELVIVMQERLGIEFPAKSIEVEFRLPRGSRLSAAHDFVALYEVDTQKMVLNPTFRDVDLSPIIKAPDASEYPEALDEIGRQSNKDLNLLREILCHELGHFYLDSYMKQHIPNSWINVSYQRSQAFTSKDIGLFIVHEGIAECFNASLCSRPDYFPDSSWTERKWNISELNTASVRRYLAYDGGYHFAKPLINAFGQDAIVYMIEHPLIVPVPDMSIVPAYQKRAFAALSKNRGGTKSATDPPHSTDE